MAVMGVTFIGVKGINIKDCQTYLLEVFFSRIFQCYIKHLLFEQLWNEGRKQARIVMVQVCFESGKIALSLANQMQI